MKRWSRRRLGKIDQRPFCYEIQRSDEELLEWLPIVTLPAGIQMVVLAGGKARMVEDQCGFGSARVEFEMDDGIDARLPMCGTPGLHDPLIWDQLYIAADNPPNCEKAPPGVRSIVAGRPENAANCFWSRIASYSRSGLGLKSIS